MSFKSSMYNRIMGNKNGDIDVIRVARSLVRLSKIFSNFQIAPA